MSKTHHPCQDLHTSGIVEPFIANHHGTVSVGTLIGRVIRGVRKKTIFQVATASITRITKLTHNTAILRYTQQIQSVL